MLQCARQYFFDPDKGTCARCKKKKGGGDSNNDDDDDSEAGGGTLSERFASSSTLIVATLVASLAAGFWILDQCAALLGGKWRELLDVMLGTARRLGTKTRLLFSALQITLWISFNCATRFPEPFEETLAALRIANLDVIPSLGLQCAFANFDYLDHMVVVSLVPIGIALAMGLKFYCMWLVLGPELEEREIASFVFLFHLLEFVVFVPVSTVVLHSFSCTAFHYDSDEPWWPSRNHTRATEEYLDKDFRVDCRSERYENMMFYAVSMTLVYRKF